MSNVGAAAASGDRLKLLKALRDRIALEIEDCPTRDLSPLTRRLQDIVNDIGELEEQQRQEKPGGSSGKRDSDAPGWTPDEDV
jgi:hypothetical protein